MKKTTYLLFDGNCNPIVTAHDYYLEYSELGDWSIGPNSSVGAFIGPTGSNFNADKVRVEWSSTAVASHAYLVFTQLDYTDTLWPQLRCCDLPPVVINGKLLDLAVGEISNKESGLLVYPNPSSDEINFYTESTSNGILRIIDEIGKIILQIQLSNGHAKISELKNGIYSVQLIENNKFILNRKVIVIK
jgi:hypothetical protein